MDKLEKQINDLVLELRKQITMDEEMEDLIREVFIVGIPNKFIKSAIDSLHNINNNSDLIKRLFENTCNLVYSVSNILDEDIIENRLNLITQKIDILNEILTDKQHFKIKTVENLQSLHYNINVIHSRYINIPKNHEYTQLEIKTRKTMQGTIRLVREILDLLIMELGNMVVYHDVNIRAVDVSYDLLYKADYITTFISVITNENTKTQLSKVHINDLDSYYNLLEYILSELKAMIGTLALTKWIIQVTNKSNVNLITQCDSYLSLVGSVANFAKKIKEIGIECNLPVRSHK